MDESWIEAAIERYERAERLVADFDKALPGVDVTVRSPDGLVEVVVSADGAIRDVVISEAARARPAPELSRVVRETVAAAADAAGWARRRLHQEMFGEFPSLSTREAQR